MGVMEGFLQYIYIYIYAIDKLKNLNCRTKLFCCVNGPDGIHCIINFKLLASFTSLLFMIIYIHFIILLVYLDIVYMLLLFVVVSGIVTLSVYLSVELL